MMNKTTVSTSRCLGRTAGILGFLGVALGAFGAHALAETLTAAGRVATWETAVLYHLIHAVALLALAGWGEAPLRRWIGWLWSIGVFIFSGSLYLLSITGLTWLGAITPLGGIAFLAGWACLLFGRYSTPSPAS